MTTLTNLVELCFWQSSNGLFTLAGGGVVDWCNRGQISTCYAWSAFAELIISVSPCRFVYQPCWSAFWSLSSFVTWLSRCLTLHCMQPSGAFAQCTQKPISRRSWLLMAWSGSPFLQTSSSTASFTNNSKNPSKGFAVVAVVITKWAVFRWGQHVLLVLHLHLTMKSHQCRKMDQPMDRGKASRNYEFCILRLVLLKMANNGCPSIPYSCQSMRSNVICNYDILTNQEINLNPLSIGRYMKVV